MKIPNELMQLKNSIFVTLPNRRVIYIKIEYEGPTCLNLCKHTYLLIAE